MCSETFHLNFQPQKIGKRLQVISKPVVKALENHLTCHCVPPENAELMKKLVTTEVQHNNNHHRHRSRHQEQERRRHEATSRCKCPDTIFKHPIAEFDKCYCDCDYLDSQCKNLKDGKEGFSIDARL